MIGGSLCSGSGGLDLGLERVLGVEWAWHADPDRDAGRVLAERWPGVPNLGDLYAVDWASVEPVHLVAAGFPCPDYSVAGRRAGISGEHGDVWHAVCDALRALRPPLVILENVDGIRTAAGLDGDAGESALGVVLADLAALGYDACWSGLRAADVGAPHGRLRWFLAASLAAPDAEGHGGAELEAGDGRERAVVGAAAGAGGRDRPGDPPPGVRVVGGGAGPVEASAPDPLGAREHADGRVRRGDAGAPRPGGPAPSALAPEPEMDGAADAEPDGGRAPADPDGADRGGRGTAGRVSSAARPGDSTADADPDDAGRGEYGRPVAVRAEFATAERGGHEDAPDAGPVGRARADRRRLEGGRGEPPRARESAPDAGSVARSAPGERDGGPGASGEPRARGDARETVDRASGRDRRRGETAPDADRRGREGERLEEPGGLESPSGGQPDRRDPDRRLGDAPTPAPDPASGGRDGWPAGEGVDASWGETPERAEGDADAGDGGRPPGGTDRDAVLGAASLGPAAATDPETVGREGRRPETAPDAGSEPAEPRSGGRAPGGDQARAGTTERDRDGLVGPTEPGAAVAAAADADDGGVGDGARAEGRPAGEREPERSRPGRDRETPADAVSEAQRRARPGDVPRAEGAGEGGGEAPPGRTGERVRPDAGDGDVPAGRVEWGVYGDAVRRWERISGQPAPRPTDDRGRLDPRFVEWMLGYPAGWVDVPGVSRTAQLRLLGNSVQVQCAERVGAWLVFLLEAGLLPDPWAEP